jgi:hypothetical protein
MSVPMLHDQRVIGAINVNRAEPGRFADKEVQLLQTFARQAVIAIENVRLFNETKEALEQKTATSEVLQAISNSVADAAPVFDTIVRSAVLLCDSMFANVLLFDGESLHFAASSNAEPSSEARARSLSEASRRHPGRRKGDHQQIGRRHGGCTGRPRLCAPIGRCRTLAPNAGRTDAA